MTRTLDEQLQALEISIRQDRRYGKDSTNLMVKWVVTINGHEFEYSEGIGHFMHQIQGLYIYKDPDKVWQELLQVVLGKLDLTYTLGELWYIKDIPFTDRVENYEELNRVYKRDKNRLVTDYGYKLHNTYVKGLTPPNKLDILYALVMDGEAIDYTFEEWANMFGSSTDSILAKDTYDRCISNYIKLRSTGIDIDLLRRNLEDRFNSEE